MSEIFLKLLIDHIVYDASSKIIIMDFIWIIILFLLENILHIFKQAAKIWITKQYKDVMPEKIMHVCQKLSLQFLEQQNIREIIKRSDSYFEKIIGIYGCISQLAQTCFVFYRFSLVYEKYFIFRNTCYEHTRFSCFCD